jgi:acylphosphatase
MPDRSRIKINIYGKVTNVGFRNAIKSFAMERGITGWVTNTPEGDVVINAEGKKPDLKGLIDFCKSGPDSAKVDRCEAYYQRYKDEFTRFEIK